MIIAHQQVIDELRLVIVTSRDDEVITARIRRAVMTRRITDSHTSSLVSELASLDGQGSVICAGNRLLCDFVLDSDDPDTSRASEFSEMPEFNAADAV